MADVNQLNVYLRCLVRARPSLTSLFWIADVNGTTVTDDDVTSDYWSTVTVRVSSFHALQFDMYSYDRTCMSALRTMPYYVLLFSAKFLNAPVGAP